MTNLLRGLLVLVGGLSLGVATGGVPVSQGDMAENPKYKFWAPFKPGATSTYTQTTKYHGAEKASVPGGVEHKTITYRLLNSNQDKAVVLTTVVEEDFLATVESAPTKLTFPAQVKAANLKAVLQEWDAKPGEDETVKVGGKDLKCKVRAGSQKVEGGTVEFKFYYSDAVPGGVVKHTRVTREGNMVVAETTTTLVLFAEGKAGKGKEKD
jgi:hypothetical protein